MQKTPAAPWLLTQERHTTGVKVRWQDHVDLGMVLVDSDVAARGKENPNLGDSTSVFDY
jgi:hypothetical protein